MHAALLDAVGAGRAALIGRQRGVALDQLDAVDRQAEFFSHDLAQGDAQSLTKIDLAAEQGDGAVRVHVEEGIDLLGIEHARSGALSGRPQNGFGRRQREANRESTGLEDRAAGDAS